MTLQLVYNDLNIPLTDVFAMLLGISFFLIFLGEFCLRLRLPELNVKGAWIFGLFLLSALFSITNSSSAGAALKYFFRHPFFQFIIYFIAAGSVIIWQGRGRLLNLYHLLCASSLLIALTSITASFYRIMFKGDIFGVTEIPYLTNNHKTLAITLVLNLPFLIIISGNLSRHKRLIYFITIALSSSAVILSFSKAAWLSLFVIFALFGFRHYRKLGLLKPIIALSVLILTALAGFYLFELLAASKDVTKAEASRFFLAWLAVQMFFEHPVAGAGIGTFTIELQRYAESLSTAGFPSLAELEAHGLVFKLLSETGAAGFIFYMAFYAAVFYAVYKAYLVQKIAGNGFAEGLLYGCMAALASLLLINSFFGTDTYSPRFWFPLAFISAHRLLLTGTGAALTTSAELEKTKIGNANHENPTRQ